jgi:hypothetical protein
MTSIPAHSQPASVIDALRPLAKKRQADKSSFPVGLDQDGDNLEQPSGDFVWKRRE